MVIAQLDILTNKYVQIILNSKLFEVWKSIAIAVGIFVLLMFLKSVFTKYIIKILDSIFKALKIKSARKILTAFEQPIKMAFIVIGVYIFLSILNSSMEWQINGIINKMLGTSIIVLFANGLTNITNNSDEFLFRATDKYDIEVNTVLIPMMAKGIKYLIIAFAIIQIANIWGLDVNAFITGIGLGGVVVALAAKDFAANMMSGVIIFMDSPFTIGDWIKCKDIEGIVEDISFRSTRIRTFDKVLITVPNSLLVNDPILNFNKRELRRVTMDIGVTYDTSIEKIQKCVDSIRDILKNHKGVDNESINVSFSNFNESSLDISMYFFINETGFNEYMKIKEEINYSIMKILSDEEISIAFPTTSVYIENK
ncbi:MAG: mechanosensitive ion channel family protein [Clostridium sp.]